MGQFVEIKTRETTKVRLNKNLVAAIEEVPSSARVEGYTKIYVAGYSFTTSQEFDEVIKIIEDTDS